MKWRIFLQNSTFQITVKVVSSLNLLKKKLNIVCFTLDDYKVTS